MTQHTPVQHGHHCVYDLHYHFVFVVKYRRALLRPDVEAELIRISHEATERHEFEIETLGADLNHVHLQPRASATTCICNHVHPQPRASAVRGPAHDGPLRHRADLQEPDHGADVPRPAGPEEPCRP